MKKTHIGETDLALLASGDTSRLRRLSLERHLRDCVECQDQVAEFQALREARLEMPELNWNQLGAEIRANIRLGLEAGECVREAAPSRFQALWNPRLAVVFACLVMLVAAGVLLNDARPRPQLVTKTLKFDPPTLESSGSGVELRTGANSLTLLNHEGAVQTVSAQGAIGARYVSAGAVTFNYVSLE